MSSALPTGFEVMRTTVVYDRRQQRAIHFAAEPRTFCLKGDVDILQHLHSVRATALLFGIEKNVALLWNGAVNHVEENRAKGLLHVGTNPDQEPVIQLYTSGQHSSDAGSSAYSDSATVEMSQVR